MLTLTAGPPAAIYNPKVKHTGNIWKQQPHKSPLSHDTVMQLVLLFDVGMIATRPLAAFAVVAAEYGGQLLLGHPVGWKGDGALLCQAPTVLQNMSHRKDDNEAKGFTSPGYLSAKHDIC